MLSKRSPDVTPDAGELTRDERWLALGYGGATVWLTGLPAAGKSTIGAGVEKRLVARGRPSYLLDGDNLRHGLNGDLGFSRPARSEERSPAADMSQACSPMTSLHLAPS